MEKRKTPCWGVRRYREGDEAGINDLFQRVFGVHRSLEEWRWKFREAPLGHTLVEVAYDGDRIVGQIAALATRFLCSGREVLAIQLVDNMIDPEYRKGLDKASMQRSLFAEGERVVREMGTVLLFGFPNRAAYRLGRKLFGYKEVGSVEVFARSLTWARHARRLLGEGRTAKVLGRIHGRIHRCFLPAPSQGPPGAEVRETREFDERFDRLWNEASKAFGMIAVRDRELLAWRYAKRPQGDYTVLILEKGEELLGYCVLALRESNTRIGIIADLLTLPEEGYPESLLASALEHFLEEGLDRAECWSVPGGRYEKAIQKYFPQKADGSALLALGIWDETIDEGVAWDMAQWHITLGDTDGI